MQGGENVSHKGQDLVTGIWFGALDQGVVSTTANNANFQGPGALFSATHAQVTKVLFSGYQVVDGSQHQQFGGLFLSASGLVALGGWQQQMFLSSDMGATFAASFEGTLGGQAGFAGGPGRQLLLGKGSNGTWLEVDSIGNVWTATQAPATATTWTRTWNPEASPSVPNPLPTGGCTHTVRLGQNLYGGHKVARSADGQTVVYTMGFAGEEPTGACVSTDGGKNFFEKPFPNPPMPATEVQAETLVFSDAMHGLAAFGNDILAEANSYVYVTSDGGNTWTAGTLPTTAMMGVAFTDAFYAPGGQDAWIVGFAAGPQAVLLHSADAGKTWTDVSSKLAGIPAAQSKMYAGFALDAKNIWIGGDFGSLLYSPTGGQ